MKSGTSSGKIPRHFHAPRFRIRIKLASNAADAEDLHQYYMAQLIWYANVITNVLIELQNEFKLNFIILLPCVKVG